MVGVQMKLPLIAEESLVRRQRMHRRIEAAHQLPSRQSDVHDRLGVRGFIYDYTAHAVGPRIGAKIGVLPFLVDQNACTFPPHDRFEPRPEIGDRIEDVAGMCFERLTVRTDMDIPPSRMWSLAPHREVRCQSTVTIGFSQIFSGGTPAIRTLVERPAVTVDHPVVQTDVRLAICVETKARAPADNAQLLQIMTFKSDLPLDFLDRMRLLLHDPSLPSAQANSEDRQRV